MFGCVTRLEEGGTVGVIECSATSGGEWVGTLQYAFNTMGLRASDVAIGDVVSFIPGQSDDGSGWALQVNRVAGKSKSHPVSSHCAEGQML